MSKVLSEYQESLSGLSTMSACEHLQEAAFRDYIHFRLSHAEYSDIYFAAESRRREIWYASTKSRLIRAAMAKA